MSARWQNNRGKFAGSAGCGCLLLAALCLTAGARTPAMSRGQRGSSSETTFAQAAALRARLEAVPAAERTRAQYEAALDGFRTVYHRWPTAGKAAAAVEAVGELLAEEGRTRGVGREHDLEAARGEYAFLLKQYPASPEVAEALLNAGELCANELHDASCARENLTAVVRRFPDSSYAEQAALDLKPASAGLERTSAEKTSAENTSVENASVDKTRVTRSATQTAVASSAGRFAAPTVESGPTDAAVHAPEPATTRRAMATTVATAASDAPVPGVRGGARSAQTAEITGIRHWSNPVSTRIAIDLSGEVEYEAARVSHPDRIFFDLHGARLARGLNGREVEVLDDGYLKRIRAAQYRPDVTRVVLDVTDVSDYSAFLLPNPWRLILDIHGGRATQTTDRAAAQTNTQPKALTNMRPGATTARIGSAENTVAEVAALSEAPSRVEATTGPTSAPVAARVNENASVTGTATGGSRSTGNPARKTSPGRNGLPSHTQPQGSAAMAAQPTADGERSLVRALGLKVNRIVIDAGHGGHDSGTLGPGGIEEKDVVLDVALRTGKLLKERLGAKVIYTRDDDTFVPLETRTAIANKAQADLFLSIHANSSPEPEARGVETYYLNFTSDPQALEVAARENAVSDAGVHQLSDLVRKIALKDKIEESREFAGDVDQSLYHGLSDGAVNFKDRGVKKAPFVVLIGAQMPSVLAEISFLTNPEDARLLRQAAWRERIAESLASGVERYLSGLSSTKPMMEAGSEPTQNEVDAADDRR